MRIFTTIAILIFGLTCLWVASSQWGIGYDPDSIIYEDVAENLFSGHGISRFEFATGDRYPMTNFPPFYPTVLGVLSQIFGSVALSARLLNTVLWMCLWGIVYLFIKRDNTSHSLAWMTASLLMLNLFVFQVFGTSWSEPLFLVLGFSGLWLILNYIKSSAWHYLVGAGLLFACAILTRYAGVALVATSALMLLMAVQFSLRKRLTSIVILGFLSGTPLLLWLMRNVSVRGDVANRDVGFTLVGVEQLDTMIRTIGTWLLPIPILAVNLIVIGLLSCLVFWAWTHIRTTDDTDSDLIITTMRWWIVIYILFIIASFTFLDPRIPFNYRMLLPAWVGVMILVGRWLTLHWHRLSRLTKMTWGLTAIILLVLNALLSVNWSVILMQSGQQYSSAIFQQSETIQHLTNNPRIERIYTNNNFLFHYLTDQPADVLPFPNDNMDNWVERLPDEPMLIVFFNALSERGWESNEQLETLLPVTRIDGDDVIGIYELERP